MSSGATQILNWNCPAGRLLQFFIRGLPTERSIILNVFGSSPLQLRLDSTFLSGDVHLFANDDLTPVLARMGLGKGQSDPYVEITSQATFIAAPTWRDRAAKESFGNVTVYVAAPIDVLVGKLKRLEEKDLRAFDLVKRLTGGPSEEELRIALGNVVDMYRPAFNEENPGGDPVANTRRLWHYLYGRDIDVRKEIIVPALALRQQAYGQSVPDHIGRLAADLRDETPQV